MYNNQYYSQVPRFQPTIDPNYSQMYQQNYSQAKGLQGKQVESIEIVKNTEIPLDGTTSYFPVADGSAIVTKQLQTDGTCKITVFKPITEHKEEVKYVTPKELEEALKELNLDDLDDIKEDIKELKKQLKKKGVKDE